MPIRRLRLAVSVLVVSAAPLAAIAAGPTVRRTFVPHWHLGDRWDVAVDDYGQAGGEVGRGRPKPDEYRFRVQAMDTIAPGVRRVHVEARPRRRRRWDRAHLVFTWRRPAEFGATGERLWMSQLTIRTRGDPPKRLRLDFGALSDDPYPVLATSAPLPVTFPVFEIGALSGTETRVFRPKRRDDAARDPPAVRQVLIDAPRLPAHLRTPGSLIEKADAGRLIAYQISGEANPLVTARQVWHPDYPWCLLQRTQGQRMVLESVRVRRGDPMDLVERAGALARRIGTAREAAALGEFRTLLTDARRRRLEGDGAPAALPVVRERTRAMLGGFALPGLTAMAARMTGDHEAMVNVAGVADGETLERRFAMCALEAGQWKLASAAQTVTVTTRPTRAP